MEQTQSEFDKCQAELLETHERLGTALTQLDMSKSDLSEREDRLQTLCQKLDDVQIALENKTKELSALQALNYPAQCATLKHQLDTLTHHTQTIEQRVETMEKERCALRMALRNQIEYLRTA